jgi:FKBP-type peptidyl-prolyl cis-trans isomerase 2
VIEMAVNTEKTVWIPVDQAFGPYRSYLIEVFNRSSFAPNQTLNIGERYDITINPSTEATTTVKIVNVTASTVTLDPNPPLTDQT